MRNQRGTAAKKEMIDPANEIFVETASARPVAVPRARVAPEAAALISLIHTEFRTHDIPTNREIPGPENSIRFRCSFPETEGILITAVPGSHGINDSLPGGRLIRKTGEQAGSEGRFGKKFDGARTGSSRHPGSFPACVVLPIPQVNALHPAHFVPGAANSRNRAKGRLAIELQNATRFTPPSGKREDKQ